MALLFEYVKDWLGKYGLSKQQLSQFETWHQINAYIAGASFEDALKFSNESQVEVLKSGSLVEDALKNPDN